MIGDFAKRIETFMFKGKAIRKLQMEKRKAIKIQRKKVLEEFLDSQRNLGGGSERCFSGQKSGTCPVRTALGNVGK